MKISISKIKKLKPVDLIVFDLDGTLIPTKSPMDKEMSRLMVQLLAVKKVAVIGGGRYEVFRSLFLRELPGPKELLKNLFLFPTTSTRFYKYNRGWKKIYAHELPKRDRKRIRKTFLRVFKELGYHHPKKVYGRLIEDRGTQVTFSVYGQDLVTALGKRGVAIKLRWKRDHSDIKMKITNCMTRYLPDLEVRAAGYTSIDVTKKGIDKAYGLREIEKYLHVKIKNMLFIGDALYPGGNDYAVTKTGVDYMAVSGPEETKRIIRQLLAQTRN